MVTLTLAQSLAFLNSLPPMVFAVTANPNNQTASSLCHTRASSGLAYYIHTESGAEKAYTMGASVKKLVYTGSSINITLDTVTGFKRNNRFSCGNNFPTALPSHQPNCSTITNGYWGIHGCAYVVPTDMNPDLLFDYFERVTQNPSAIGTLNYRKPLLNILHLNDFSESKIAY